MLDPVAHPLPPSPPSPRPRLPRAPAAGDEEDKDLDPAILARLRGGEPAAIAELYAAFGGRVHRLCRRLTNCDADAEDATQEVFLRAWEQIARFDGRSRFSTWLYRLTVNHTINLNRRAARRQTLALDRQDEAAALPDPSGASPLELASRTEMRAAVDAALGLLPADQRTVVVLREYEGLSYAEIGAILGLSAGTVTSRLVRGRAVLAAALRRRLGDGFFS